MNALPLMAAAEAGQGSEAVPTILLTLAFVLVGAKLAGELVERLGQPAVLGELVVGITLGNAALLGGPDTSGLAASETFTVLAELGAVLLLFHVGLESTPKEMMAVGGRAALVAVVGVVTPMLLGFGVGELLRPDESWMLHAFLGAMLAATSVGITARVLKMPRPSARASPASSSEQPSSTTCSVSSCSRSWRGSSRPRRRVRCCRGPRSC